MLNIFGNLRREKPSKYNVDVPYGTSTLIYNQITGCLIELDEAHLKQYKKISSGNFYVNRKFLKALRQGGFIIPRKRDELAWMDLAYRAKSNSTYHKGLTIAPTDKCNLDCVYCFEDKHNWVAMSEEIQEKVKEFAKVFVTATPTKRFGVTWFGGEPTLHMSCIENLSRYLTELCRQNNILFNQSIITNGTTLTEGVSRRLKDLGIMKVQITIDGPSEIHDKRRPFRGCSKSSFEQIVSHLQRLREEGFSISLRVNLDTENAEYYSSIVKYLTDRGLLGSSESGGSIRIHAAYVFGTDKSLPKDAFACSNPQEVGFFKGSYCMADRRYAIAISPTGVLTKCWNHTTNECHSIGSVDNLEIAAAGYADDHSPIVDAICSNCNILPLCWGGCRWNNLYWESGPSSAKYDGCDTARWTLAQSIIKLKERLQMSRVTNQSANIKRSKFDA